MLTAFSRTIMTLTSVQIDSLVHHGAFQCIVFACKHLYNVVSSYLSFSQHSS